MLPGRDPPVRVEAVHESERVRVTRLFLAERTVGTSPRRTWLLSLAMGCRAWWISALASSVAEIRPEFTHYAEIVGTLAYLAPEATGRTGRPARSGRSPRGNGG